MKNLRMCFMLISLAAAMCMMAQTPEKCQSDSTCCQHQCCAKDNASVHVQQQPSFPGGEAAMYQWLCKNIKYPKEAGKDKASGKVVVSFMIQKDGSIDDVEVVKAVHPALDAEAVRVIKAMPKWQPGLSDGEPVNVKYQMPVTFNLTK